MGNIFGVKKIEPSANVARGNNSVDFSGIPGDLIVKILSKLPVKSLTRFKSVCKAWNFLINSQVFINTHLDTENPRFGMYALRGPKKGDSICPVEISYIVGASNGIICLKTRSFDENPLVLFHPSTREYSYVPPQLCVVNGEYGFCYLPKTQEYQIVCFDKLFEDKKLIDITTLTLGKNSSSRIAKNISLPGREISSGHATSGATMLWLGREHDSNKEIVIIYDVMEEKFGTMNAPPSPSPPPSNSVCRSLALLKVSVIMLDNFMYDSTFFDIWMLINDDVSNGKSWMKYRRVGPFCNIFGMRKNVYPLGVCWDDRWILCCTYDLYGRLASYDSRNIFFYDLDTDQGEDYCKIRKDKEGDYEAIHEPILEFVNYQESLVSIDSLLPYIDHEHPENIH